MADVALPSLAIGLQAITVHTSCNTGSQAQARILPAGEYAPLWKIPWDARTDRYEVDLQPAGVPPIANATSFAVYRQLAKVVSVDLDKTFFTSGDPVNPRNVVRKPVSGEVARMGQEALWYDQSQDGTSPPFRVLEWQDHAEWNEQH